MNLSASLLQENNAIAALSHQAGADVTSAIKSAAQDNNIDFEYLLKKAQVESSFRTDVGAKTSSAQGLFQFTKSTWLEMIEKYGEKHGVQTDQSDDALLSLRNNPELSAQMAAEYANQNKRALERNWDGDVGSTELYMAHFLGPNGAAKFLNALNKNPSQNAENINKSAAKANVNIFYDRETKAAKSLEDVYAHFAEKFGENKRPTSIEDNQNILNTVTGKVTDESYRLYEHTARPFFERNTASAVNNLNDLFRTQGNSVMLASQSLWQMASVDFIGLLTDRKL